MKRKTFKDFVFAILCVVLFSGYAQAVMPDNGGPSGTEQGQTIDEVKDGNSVLLEKIKTGEEKKYKDGELLVKFKKGTSDGQKQSRHSKHHAKRLKKYKHIEVDHVRLDTGVTVEDAMAQYKADPDVEYAEPNYIVKALGMPNDPLLGNLWGMNNTGQTGGTSGADIKAPQAWDITTGSSDVVVTVIDSGIDYTHEDLVQNLWVNTGEIPGNGIDDDGNGYIDDVYGINAITGSGDPFDDLGHGTHCAGTIGAVGNNGIGVAGVNWNVRIMACKFLGSNGLGDISDAAECLDYVKMMKDRGANVVGTNNSWGCEGSSGCYSQALYDAIKIHMDNDILFVAAAGNSGSDNDTYDNYPSDYELPNVIAVAATDHNDARASFSSYGRHTVHVGAPGAEIYSTVPGGRYESYSGTSMAAPHVAGLAALVKSQDMNRDWRSIKNVIISAGDNLGSLNGLVITGKRISAYESLICSNQPVFAVLKYPSTMQQGVTVTLSALSINCADPVGPVTATADNGDTITLSDDGISPDVAAGDGIFTGNWTPSSAAQKITFSSSAGSEIIRTPALGIQTTSLAEGSMTEAYDQTLQASGGLAPYTWWLTSGALPDGLALEGSTGKITGMPQKVGAFKFTVLVRDAESSTAAKNLTISVADLKINTYYLSSAADGQYYRQQVAATSGTPPYAWSLTSGSLPAGLALDSSTGEISGTPSSQQGVYAFTIQVSDAQYKTASASLELGVFRQSFAVIKKMPINISASDMAMDQSGNYYFAGAGPNPVVRECRVAKLDPMGNELWTASYPGAGGWAWCEGVAVDSAGNVVVTGIDYGGVPSSQRAGFTRKYDSSGNVLWTNTTTWDVINLLHAITADKNGNVYVTGTTSYGYVVWTIKYNASGQMVWQNHSSGRQGYGIIVDDAENVYVSGYGYNWGDRTNEIFSTKFDQSGQVLLQSTYNTGGIDMAQGQGIALDRAANFYVTGFIYDSYSTPADFATLKYDQSGNLAWIKRFDWNGMDCASYGAAVDGKDNVFVSGFGFAVGSSYSSLVAKYNPSGDVVWAQRLNEPSNYYARRVIVDGSGVINVFDPGAGIIQLSAVPLAILTSSLPAASNGSYYSQKLVATGGVSAYTWSVVAGSLPNGIALDGSTGELIGTPTTGGTSEFTVQIMDAENVMATRQFSITVTSPLVIRSRAWWVTPLNQSDSWTHTATGGVPPYIWEIVSGRLANGLSLDSATGTVSGAATELGWFNYTLRATDSIGATDTEAFQFYVYQLLTIDTQTLATGVNGVAYSQTLIASGGTPPYTWYINPGTLPSGLSLNSSTGVITGTPSAAGIFSFTAQVTDAHYAYDTQALSINIKNAIIASSDVNGTITPSGVIAVDSGGSQTFAITSVEGHHISDVVVDGVSVGAVSEYIFENVTSNHTISATFAINTYTVTPTAGPNGSLSPSVPQTVNHLQSAVFSAASYTGYHIDSVTGCGGTLNGGTYTTGPITADCTVTATFAINTYTVTPTAGPNGTISPATLQMVDFLQPASFTITPNTGYHIASVTGCSGTLNGSTYVTGPVTDDCTVSATFAINTYTVTPTAGPNGSLSPSVPQTVNHLQSAVFSAATYTGYHIDSVTGCGGTLNGGTYTTGPITADCTVTATFAINTYTVTSTAGPNGTISPSTPQPVNYNQAALFTLTPNNGYHIDTVTGCNGTLNNSTYTTGPITADCTVTAAFAIDTHSLIITKAGTGSGTVASSPSGINCGTSCSATYDYGTSVTLTAARNPDSFFAGWSGGGCSGTGTCVTTMDADKAAIATFTQYITITTPNGGESWNRGSTYTIRWNYAGNPGSNVKIELLKGGVVNRTITSSTSRGTGGSGSYSWRISNSQATSSDYTIRVTSTSNSNYKDVSDANFTIQ